MITFSPLPCSRRSSKKAPTACDTSPPQFGMFGHLAGVVVEAAVLGVEDAGPQIGQVNLRNIPHVVGDTSVGVFYVG